MHFKANLYVVYASDVHNSTGPLKHSDKCPQPNKSNEWPICSPTGGIQ